MSPLLTMSRALLYLRVTSLVGRVKSRLRRLREPKYLAGAVVGVGYLYFAFIRRAHGLHAGHAPGAPPGPGIPAAALAFLPEVAALALLLSVVANWAMPRSASLVFSEAEIAFLFPAPVNRRMLVHYRILGSQLGIAFTALVLTVVFRRGQAFGGNAWFHAIGWWLILATLNLHFTGTSFVYSRLLNRSLTSGWRKVMTIGVIWCVAAALILWVWSVVQLPQRSDLNRPHGMEIYLAAQLNAGPLPWLLAIPRLVVTPYFAMGNSAFLLALGPALALLVVHYFWVVHTEVSFEEASIARAEKRAARVQRAQQGDWRGQNAGPKAQRAPFRLLEGGRPEVAFFWKNLLSSSGFFRPRVLVVVLAIVLVGSEWLVVRPEMRAVRLFTLMMFAVLLALTLLIGPMLARQDLRTDLPNSDILKTYPLRGWQIVLGELLAPLTILSSLIWVSLFAGALLLPADKFLWLTPALRGAAALALAVLAPPLVAIQLLVPNATAIVFPAWTQSAGDRTERGIEVIGQRIIFIAGQLLISLIAVVPAMLSAALVIFLTAWLVGPVMAGLLAVAVVFSLLGYEVWLGVRWLGGRFEQFDLSAELRP